MAGAEQSGAEGGHGATRTTVRSSDFVGSSVGSHGGFSGWKVTWSPSHVTDSLAVGPQEGPQGPTLLPGPSCALPLALHGSTVPWLASVSWTSVLTSLSNPAPAQPVLACSTVLPPRWPLLQPPALAECPSCGDLGDSGLRHTWDQVLAWPLTRLTLPGPQFPF